MNTTTNRRTFLAAAPAGALAATGATLPLPVAAHEKLGLPAVVNEYRAAVEEFNNDNDVTDARYMAAYDALLAARPTDPAELAAQLRWVTDELARGIFDIEYAEPILRHIAEQLEALGSAALIYPITIHQGRPAGRPFFSDDAPATAGESACARAYKWHDSCQTPAPGRYCSALSPRGSRDDAQPHGRLAEC